MLFRKCQLHKLLIRACVLGVLLAGMVVMGVSAGSISLDVPTEPANTGEVISIPVIITGAEDIAGLTIDVSNTVPGAIILIDTESMPISKGTYMFNSEEENDVQRVVWYSSKGFTADNQKIFSLTVQVVSPDVTEVPITITPVTVVNSASGFLTETYPVTEVTSFPLSGSVVGNVLYGKSESIQPVVDDSPVATPSVAATNSGASTPSITNKPTASPTSSVILPTQSTGVENSAVKQTGESTEVPTNVATVPEPLADQGTPVSTQASPLGVFPLLGIGFAGLLLILKK